MTSVVAVALSIADARYPTLLREIPDPPGTLFVMGRGSKINTKQTIAVVGARNITPYGVAVTTQLVRDLVANGFTIVSGLAEGVDTLAHRTAIDSGGKTIAVLGSGIHCITPSGNTDLYWEIVHGNGAVVSEVAGNIRTDTQRFVTRNRIISGLSLGVVVIEGSFHSGTLITAAYAAEQGREVFAVPGSILSANSRGPARLLKNGAKLVETVNDILEELA